MAIDRRNPIPLYIQLANTLRIEIVQGHYTAGEKIPSEREIMQKHHLSRNTVRQAIHMLNEEGLIHSDHGMGTFATNLSQTIPSRIDVFAEHSEFLKLAGYETDYKILSIKNVLADKMLSEKLGINVGSPVLALEKLFYANKKPAIYTIDYVPGEFDIPEDSSFEIDPSKNFLAFIEDKSRSVVEFGLSDIIPIIVDEKISEKMQIPIGQPILMMTEVFLDPLQQKRIGLGTNYYGNFIQFSILRRRSFSRNGV